MEALDSWKCMVGWGMAGRDQMSRAGESYALAFDLLLGNTWFKKRDNHLITYKSGNIATQIDFSRRLRTCTTRPNRWRRESWWWNKHMEKAIAAKRKAFKAWKTDKGFTTLSLIGTQTTCLINYRWKARPYQSPLIWLRRLSYRWRWAKHWAHQV